MAAPPTSRAAARGPRVLAGTSGFSYPAWRGAFYPADLPASKMLRFYARALGTVEINHTFRRLPTAALLAGWARETPPGFRFALKAPQRITHQLRLRDAGEPTLAFCTVARQLGRRLGPLLFQLPPYLRRDPARLAGFLAVLPAGLEYAVEFRDETWFADATYTLLARHRVALCVADAEALTTPLVPTAPFGYLRLRREDYAEGDVAAWAQRICAVPGWKRAYVYFKHEAGARGATLARLLQERVVPR
jgi:uncharacterized protein YecE (DUF72 family)